MSKNILQLYADDNKTVKGYPITSAKLVIRENGNSMEDFDKEMSAKHELFEKEAEEKLKEYVDALPSNIKVQKEKPENNNVLWLQPEELLQTPEEVTEAVLNRMTEHESQLKNKANQSDVDEINSQLAENANKIDTKVDKVIGKGLSTNDYDNTEKAEVAKIANKMESTKGTFNDKFIELYLGNFLQSESGFTQLPNGLILQWGRSSGSKDVYFPIAFPNACLNVFVNGEIENGASNVYHTLSNVYAKGKTAFTLVSYGYANLGATNTIVANQKYVSTTGVTQYTGKSSWIAIGY